MLHVPYKSSPPAIQDVLAGRVSMTFTDLTIAIPHVRAGTLRALASTRLKRSALFPELPTLDEAGVTGFDMDSWAGIVVPANTPPEVVTRLNTELRRIIDSPEVKSMSAMSASRRSRARPASSTASSRANSAIGAKWSRTPASSRSSQRIDGGGAARRMG